jgi:hypothetical protein
MIGSLTSSSPKHLLVASIAAMRHAIGDKFDVLK